MLLYIFGKTLRSLSFIEFFVLLIYNDKRKFLESLYINNTKNSINDKDRNVFPKIYSNIKNLN